MTVVKSFREGDATLHPVAKLVALLVDGGSKSTYILQFPSPLDDNLVLAAPAKLVLGDDTVVDLGVIVAPTQVTWRTMRSVTLVENVPMAEDGQEAVLLWGTEAIVATVVDGDAVVVQDGLAVALLHVTPVPNSPMELQVELQVTDMPADHMLRIDAGGSNQREWRATGVANAEGMGHKVEWRFTYSKPGPYLLVVDLVDAEGYWVDQVAEQAIEVIAPTLESVAASQAHADENRPSENEAVEQGEDFAAPLEVVAAAATLPTWQPFRYARPLWAWTRMYSQPGGTVVTRSLVLGTYLAIRQEVVAGGQIWYQSTALDWIPASSVAIITPSALRGVELAGIDPDPDPDPGPDPEPKPDPDPDPENLPKGIVTANVLNVRSGAGTSYPVVDQLRYNAQVTIFEQKSVAGATWYRIGTGRWVHSGWVRLVGTPPPGPTPTRRGVVTADVLNVRARPGVGSTNPPIDRLLKGAEVFIYEERLVSGATWFRIGVDRWVHGTWIKLVATANDSGVNEPKASEELSLLSQTEVAAAPALPLAWVVTATLNVRAEPNTTSTVVGTVNKYDRLSILETRTVAGQRWYRIGENRWIYGANVGVATLKARPTIIRASEKWVGVNLREQTVVAYEGDKPVYAALAATGLPATPTVQGIFRTWLRLMWRKMSGGSAATGGYYYLEEVPWTLYFYSGYALNGAYWHDAFGRPRSHGCVNLSLYDSWWIFKWSEPDGKNSPAVYVYWE